MKKLVLLAAIAVFGVGLCSAAMAASLEGTVWLQPEEEAACAMVFLYNDQYCTEYYSQQPTDSCGYYKFEGLSVETSYYVHIEFPLLQCTMGSYYGTCPYTEIDCVEVVISSSDPSREKDWYLGLSECYNIGCED